jgi:hypothetical protein
MALVISIASYEQTIRNFNNPFRLVLRIGLSPSISQFASPQKLLCGELRIRATDAINGNTSQIIQAQ